MHPDALISKEYLAEMQRLHADPRGFGGKGRKWAGMIADLATQHWPVDCVLDYGCGQGSLGIALRGLGFRIRNYDPAIPKYSDMPKPSDLVACTDVLEHVEPDRLWAVLGHLAGCTQKAAFVVISTVETAKTLSDGRQAHISLHSRGWWLDILRPYFKVKAEWTNRSPKGDKQIILILTPKAE